MSTHKIPTRMPPQKCNCQNSCLNLGQIKQQRSEEHSRPRTPEIKSKQILGPWEGKEEPHSKPSASNCPEKTAAPNPGYITQSMVTER